MIDCRRIDRNSLGIFYGQYLLYYRFLRNSIDKVSIRDVYLIKCFFAKTINNNACNRFVSRGNGGELSDVKSAYIVSPVLI